jgi:class 3 adenylate cyclase
VRVEASLEKWWFAMTDTDHRNKADGLPPTRYEDLPHPRGGSTLIANTVLLGATVRYIDQFEWIHGRWLANTKTTIQGMMGTIAMIYDFEKHDDHAFTIRAQIKVSHTRWWAHPLVMLFFKKWLRKNLLGDKNINRFDTHETLFPALPIDASSPSHDREALRAMADRLLPCSPNKELRERVARYLLDAADHQLARIRPYELARLIGFDKLEVLRFMLNGTLQGLFDMNWDLLCPSCRGAKYSASSLKEMKKSVHCPSCNIDFEAEFDRNVELTFCPHPAVRAVDGRTYCVGNPAKTMHILVQRWLGGGESITVDMELKAGRYRIGSPQLDGYDELEVVADGAAASEAAFVLGAQENRTNAVLRAGAVRLRFDSRDPESICVRLERTAWVEHAVTAAEVTAMPEFRKSFSSEVLKPGLQMGIHHVAILFTDLKESTRYYSQHGDAAAYNIVHDHFVILEECVEKNRGSVVKTIGDAIMAVFPSALEAFKAALAIHAGIASFNAGLSDRSIIVKTGLHAGPVLAINANDRLDYFGQTVNFAARTNGHSHGGDIVLAESVWLEHIVPALPDPLAPAPEIFVAHMKGIDGEHRMVRCQAP